MFALEGTSRVLEWVALITFCPSGEVFLDSILVIEIFVAEGTLCSSVFVDNLVMGTSAWSCAIKFVECGVAAIDHTVGSGFMTVVTAKCC